MKISVRLNDYFANVGCAGYGFSLFPREVESGSSQPSGPYLCFTYVTFEWLRISLTLAMGQHNHERYLMRKL